MGYAVYVCEELRRKRKCPVKGTRHCVDVAHGRRRRDAVSLTGVDVAITSAVQVEGHIYKSECVSSVCLCVSVCVCVYITRLILEARAARRTAPR